MAATPIFRGIVESGKIKWHGVDRKRLDVLTKHLEGKEIELTLRAVPKKRSLRQNSYYWGVLVAMMAEEAGYERPEEMHDALRMHFLLKHTDAPLPTIRSTTELTTVEFEEYMSKCRQLASEVYGLYVPEPNEVAP